VRRDDIDFEASLFGNRSASKKTRIALVPQQSQSKATLKPTDVLFPYESFVRYYNWDRPIMAPCGLTNCGNRFLFIWFLV
jgi:ubiquitin carboxyl-terminal hydrolase 36/42